MPLHHRPEFIFSHHFRPCALCLVVDRCNYFGPPFYSVDPENQRLGQIFITTFPTFCPLSASLGASKIFEPCLLSYPKPQKAISIQQRALLQDQGKHDRDEKSSVKITVAPLPASDVEVTRVQCVQMHRVLLRCPEDQQTSF